MRATESPQKQPGWNGPEAARLSPEGDLITVRPQPCRTCPYRKDAPSGFWAASEYARLAAYDGDVPDQVMAGATGLFFCHQLDDVLCAGWAGCHDMDNNAAVRMRAHQVDPAVYDYVSPVPLFASGGEAAAHGMRDIDAPGPEIRAMQRDLIRKRARRDRTRGTGNGNGPRAGR